MSRSAMDKKSSLEFNDLQALLRFGHGQLSEARFLLLQVQDLQAARNWLLSAPVTTAISEEVLPTQALQIAFTSAGLRSMEMDQSIIDDFSEEFIAGMTGNQNRSRRLGDEGVNNPDNWEWGGTVQSIPDLIVMLYASTGGLNSWQKKIQSSHFDAAFKLLTSLDTQQNGRFEPFGFVDGISQPKIDWQRSISTDVHERDNYSNLLALGEVVLGYPNEYGLYTGRPLLNEKVYPDAVNLPVAEDCPELRDLACNGSYLVVRQLAQDVPGFWQFIDQSVESNADKRNELAAAMVGRQRDGSPIAAISTQAISGIDEKQKNSNNFTFDEDTYGSRCPIGAHIRRANPRNGDFPPGVTGFISRLIRALGFPRRHPREDLVASTRFHRILRRGRTYGSALTPEDAVRSDAPVEDRGLQFACLGANISRQFDFVQNAWMMSSKFSGLPTESDPLLGNRAKLLNGDSTDRFTMPQHAGPARCIAGLPQFVTVRGGAYFFMPGIKALKFIARMDTANNKK